MDPLCQPIKAYGNHFQRPDFRCFIGYVGDIKDIIYPESRVFCCITLLILLKSYMF